MITRGKHSGLWEATCDNCSVEFAEVEADSFEEAVQELKKQGWRIYKDEEDEWTHSCLECGLTR